MPRTEIKVDKDVQKLYFEYRKKYKELRNEYVKELQKILKEKHLTPPSGAVRDADGKWGHLTVAAPPAFLDEVDNCDHEAYEACKDMFLGVGVEFLGEPMCIIDEYMTPFRIADFSSQDDLTPEQKEEHQKFLWTLSNMPLFEKD